jgi:hypothetical protein
VQLGRLARRPGAGGDGTGEAWAGIAAKSSMLRPVLAPVVPAIAAVVCSSAAWLSQAAVDLVHVLHTATTFSMPLA